MQICFLAIDASIPGNGGPSVHTTKLAFELRKMGHETSIISMTKDEDTILLSEFGTVYGIGPRSAYPLLVRRVLVFTRAILYLLSLRNQIDVIYQRFFPDWRHPTILPVPLSFFFMIKLLRIPFAIEINYPPYAFGSHSLLKFILERACAVYVPCRGLKVFLEKIGCHSKIYVNPNGADLSEFGSQIDRCRVKEEMGIDNDYNVVLYIGWLCRGHGADILMKAIPLVRERLSSIAFLIVGDGPLKNWMIRYSSWNGLDNCCFFVGSVPHEYVPTLIAVADVGVAPYSREDSRYLSPLKIFEYLAGGVPVVASNSGTCAEVLSELGEDFLFVPDDEKSLANKILQALLDKRLAKEYGKRGRRLIEEKYTWEKNALLVDNSLRKCVNKSKSCETQQKC